MPKPKKGVYQPHTGSGSTLEFPRPPADQPDDVHDHVHSTSTREDGTDMPDSAPTFAMVRESGIDGQKRCLYLVVESTKGEYFRINFTPGCIPLAMAALSGELGFLRRHQPDLNEVVQPIVIEASQIGETANRAPTLLARMEGGGELPLQMSLTSLQQLAQQIDDYIRKRVEKRQKR